LIVGGSSQTVTSGGYTQGGGHSILSRMLGLAVDQVLEMTVCIYALVSYYIYISSATSG